MRSVDHGEHLRVGRVPSLLSRLRLSGRPTSGLRRARQPGGRDRRGAARRVLAAASRALWSCENSTWRFVVRGDEFEYGACAGKAGSPTVMLTPLSLSMGLIHCSALADGAQTYYEQVRAGWGDVGGRNVLSAVTLRKRSTGGVIAPVCGRKSQTPRVRGITKRISPRSPATDWTVA